jgi:hypothetical protein
MGLFNNFSQNDRILPRIGLGFPRSMPFPLLLAAVDEAEANIQAPRALVFTSALTAISVACQGLIDVCRPSGQLGPTSLMALIIAESGDRKSTSENIFFKSIREIQKEHNSNYNDNCSDWCARTEVWKAKRKILLKKVSVRADNGLSTEEEELCLLVHEKIKPVKPKQFKMLYEDSTSEALFFGLHQNIPTAGLVSSEGGGVLKGGAFNDLSKQNAIWSGDAVTVDRTSVESFEVVGARLTVSIMTQGAAFKDYMEKRGEASRGSGLWARFLVCKPESNQGFRFIKSTTTSWGYCNNFSIKIKEIILKNLVLLNGVEADRLVVRFSPEASERWLDVYNAIESEIRPGGRFEGAGDHASKLPDNIARFAALAHYFEGFDGDISLSTLNASIDICCWYSDQFFSIFVPPSQESVDADELGGWLRKLWEDGHRSIRKNDILQYGPSQLRKKCRLDLALNLLCEAGLTSLSKQGKVAYVDLL